MTTRSVTHWLRHAWDTPDQIFERAFPFLCDVEFDTLVGIGVSGCVIVPTLARILDVNFAIVRKSNDGSHGWHQVEGIIGDSWVFVDDLICSGNTAKRVFKCMREFRNKKFQGAYLYDGDGDGPEFAPYVDGWLQGRRWVMLEEA